MRNIVDVGYGVSQILPLVVELVRGARDRLYMLQQPEVHLHPRAQAELGSLFGALVKAQSKRFLVETHSDYIIDRVRMDVRDKKSIRPEDVMILFFEMHKEGARIHPIEVDAEGNLVNAPPTYRRFFLEEERRFLGV
jgi:predicted ATPase